MQAMIFAAGLGTRLKPLTDTMPKALVRVGDVPLLRLVIDRVRAAGIQDVVVNVHHFAQQITDYLATETHCAISDESDMLRETGGALRHAATLLGVRLMNEGGVGCNDGATDNDYVLVHNVDILSNTDLVALTSHLDCDARLLVSERATQRYLLFDDDMRLVGWTNIKTGEVKTPYQSLDVERCRRLAFAGIHVISKGLIAEMGDWPERFSIIDYYLAKCSEHRIYGYVQEGLQLLDVGKIDSLAEAEAYIVKSEECIVHSE